MDAGRIHSGAPYPEVAFGEGFIRHARISETQASEFWERMAELTTEFDKLPRSGETGYGFRSASSRLTIRSCPAPGTTGRYSLIRTDPTRALAPGVRGSAA